MKKSPKKKILKPNKIYCGNAIELLDYIDDESIDAIITDPPYGIGRKYDEKEEFDNPEDYYKWLKPIYHKMWGKLAPGGLFAMWQTTKYMRYFWDVFGDDIHIYASCKSFVQIRNTPINHAYDPIIMKYKEGPEPLKPQKQARSFDYYVCSNSKPIYKKDTLEGKHPCPRPIDQLTSLIGNFVIEDGLILDPFMGIGTTAVAAKALGRDFMGIEINQKYVDVANDRLRQEVFSYGY